MTETPALPMFLALATAMLFGSAAHITRRGLRHLDAQTGSMISMGTTVLVYLLSAPFWMRRDDWLSPGLWVFLAIGFLHPLLSMFFGFEANRRVGPTISSALCATAPLFATATAVFALGEALTPAIGLGTLLTIGGIVLLSWYPQGVTVISRAALLYAFGAAFIRGVTHTVGKFGLSLLPNPVMAGFTCFGVGFCGAILFFYYRTGRLPQPARIPAKGYLYFGITGIFISVAIACMYGALSTGRVVIVSPVIATFPVFTLLTALIFRQEAVSRRLVFGVLTVVAGVVLISIARSA